MRTFFLLMALYFGGLWLGRAAGRRDAAEARKAEQAITEVMEGWLRVAECYRNVARTHPNTPIRQAKEEVCDGNTWVDRGWYMPNGTSQVGPDRTIWRWEQREPDGGIWHEVPQDKVWGNTMGESGETR
jgi:hypothetical protein